MISFQDSILIVAVIKLLISVLILLQRIQSKQYTLKTLCLHLLKKLSASLVWFFYRFLWHLSWCNWFWILVFFFFFFFLWDHDAMITKVFLIVFPTLITLWSYLCKSQLCFLFHFPENEATSLKKNKTNGFCGADVG